MAQNDQTEPSEGDTPDAAEKISDMEQFVEAQANIEAESRALLDAVNGALRADDIMDAVRLVQDMHAADLAKLLALMTSKNRRRLIEGLGSDIDPELFYEVEGSVQHDLYEAAPNHVIANAVTELDTDDAVYVLEDLDEEDRAEILEHLPQGDRAAIEEGLSYPEDSAGRLMQRDLVSLPEFWTIGQTIDFLRSEKENLPEEFYDLFVIDPAHRLVGTIPLSRVMRSKRHERIGDIMDTDVRRVNVLADQEDVAYEFSKYHLISAPVVDASERVVGVVTVDDVVEVLEAEAGEDILALAGVGESSVHESFSDITRDRFTWLAVNLLTAILASAVIGLFDATIEQMVPLAILMPIVASMGGNAGTQTMTVTVRALATKDLTSSNITRVLTREVLMAFLNGMVLALFSAVVVFFWFSNVTLAMVFAVGMVVNMVTAGLFGLMIPVGLNKAGIDPAISSSVFVTTITDVVGFMAFLGLAAWFLI